jgi:integrase
VLFSYAITEELRADNPAQGVERNQEEGREVFLTAKQLREVLLALDDIEAKAITAAPDVVRFMVVTGARSAEARTARWEQFDLEAEGACLWTKPAATTKQKKTHRSYLTRPAMEILAKRRELRSTEDGGFVFPGFVKGEPVKQIRSTWQLVRQALPYLAEVRPHDLRHSFASLGIAGGLSLPVIGGLLGHTTPRTTQRYAHLADDLMREASARVSAQLVAGEE